MNDTNVFALAQMIKEAGSDPSEVTEAVWQAGYHRPERLPEDAVALTLEIISGCEVADMPWEVCPKDYSGVQKEELNEFVFPALMHEGATAVSVARSLMVITIRRPAVSKAFEMMVHMKYGNRYDLTRDMHGYYCGEVVKRMFEVWCECKG